jgi:hypothetical protein
VIDFSRRQMAGNNTESYLIVPSRLADASSAFIGISTGISSCTPSGGMAAVMAGFAFGQEHSY